MRRLLRNLSITSFLILLLVHTSFGQDLDSLAGNKKNYFFISPLTLVDVINPSLTIGYERFISDNIGLQIEGGPIMKHSLIGYFFTGLGFGTRDAWWRNRGGKARLEFKYYPTRYITKSKSRYYSVELFVTKNSSNVTDLYTVKDTIYDYSNTDVRFAGDGIYDDFYIHERTRYGMNFIFGLQEFDKNKITLDTYFGIGIVYQTSQQIGRANYNDEPFQGNNWIFLNPRDRFLPNLTAGIKIGLKK